MVEHELIRVAVLDDHQGIIDGYRFRMLQEEDMDVVAGIRYGDELDSLMAEQRVDVLLLDVHAPTSPDNLNPYPILFTLPRLLGRFPELKILVISVENRPGLIRAVLEAGASGYILKDDHTALMDLGNIIRSVRKGGVYLSRLAYSNHLNASGLPHLAPRQKEALSLCAAYPNLSTTELAQKLGVAHSTFRNLLSKAYVQLRVNNRSGAILEAARLGLIPFPIKQSSD